MSVLINGFILFVDDFQDTLAAVTSPKWGYDLLPDDDFRLVNYHFYYEPYFASSFYPAEDNPQTQRDRQNRQRLIAHYEALLPHLQSSFQQFNGWARVDYFFKRLTNYRLQLRTVTYASWDSNPEQIVGIVDSLPIWLRGIGRIGWPTFINYPLWSYDEAMDEDTRSAIFEIRDGLRPWTLGAYDAPVANDGHPGLLEIHRQLTGAEDLGVYYQPTLRDLASENTCPDTVFVRVTVSGNRLESGDLILPRGTSWPYNHYGQVRVRRLVDGVPYAVSAWQWIRAREQVVSFLMPKKRPDADPGLVMDVAEYQAYGGLTVSATVLG
jgi:hypothetical protein